MHRFVVGASQDVLEIPDPVIFWAVRIILLLAAVLGGWLTFDTRGALKTMVGFSSRFSPLAKRSSINPERAGWIWFYRIDGAVVLAGVIWIFSRYYFTR
jgi:hypothetical protein